ncbi:immunity 22 family protein [Janthinobacterium sp. DSP2-3-3]|uniref:immunity 22 family protein n=1 Tax=unclassified Janthinobacterium TaxID=2610881 RepID=UPI003CF4FD55
MSDSMLTVHVFACSGRFVSREALQAYLSPRYTQDGAELPPPFFLETGLTHYEPAGVESTLLASPAPLVQLLDGISYGDSWLAQACADADAQGLLADTSVCVFAPNQLAHPERSSLHHVGSYAYAYGDG